MNPKKLLFCLVSRIDFADSLSSSISSDIDNIFNTSVLLRMVVEQLICPPMKNLSFPSASKSGAITFVSHKFRFESVGEDTYQRTEGSKKAPHFSYNSIRAPRFLLWHRLKLSDALLRSGLYSSLGESGSCGARPRTSSSLSH